MLKILFFISFLKKVYCQIDLGINYNYYHNCIDLIHKKIWFENMTSYLSNYDIYYKNYVKEISQQLVQVCYKIEL
jgi:hypothetical protein